MILPAVKYGLVLWGSCCNSNTFKSTERLYCRAAPIIYNLPKDMASEDVLRLGSVAYLFIYYKLDVLRLFYRAHRKSLPDIMYENIGQNRVSTSLIRYQNRFLVPRYESRYMKDSLSYIEAHRYGTLTIMTGKYPRPGILRVNFCKNRERPATREDSNFLIFCSNDLYSKLFWKVLFKLFEVLEVLVEIEDSLKTVIFLFLPFLKKIVK